MLIYQRKEKIRLTNCSKISLGEFFSFLSVATLPVLSYDKIVLDLMVKLPDLVKVVLYDFIFFFSQSSLSFSDCNQNLSIFERFLKYVTNCYFKSTHILTFIFNYNLHFVEKVIN